MCRADVVPSAVAPLAALLSDMRDRLAEVEGVDPANVRVGPVDFGTESGFQHEEPETMIAAKPTDPEPECCGAPMVHNSFTSEYECVDAYFALVDEGIFEDGESSDYVEVADLTPPMRERYEHWLAVRVSDAAAAGVSR
jgi:hypothetical protein